MHHLYIVATTALLVFCYIAKSRVEKCIMGYLQLLLLRMRFFFLS